MFYSKFERNEYLFSNNTNSYINLAYLVTNYIVFISIRQSLRNSYTLKT